MGLYDVVLVNCQKDGCNGHAEFQSKAGDCTLSYYAIDRCPLWLYRSIVGESAPCQKCAARLKVPTRTAITEELRDRVQDVIDDDWDSLTSAAEMIDNILQVFAEFIEARENPQPIDVEFDDWGDPIFPASKNND